MRCIEKVLDALKVFKQIKIKVLICSNQFWKYNVYQHKGTTLVYLIAWEFKCLNCSNKSLQSVVHTSSELYFSYPPHKFCDRDEWSVVAQSFK